MRTRALRGFAAWIVGLAAYVCTTMPMCNIKKACMSLRSEAAFLGMMPIEFAWTIPASRWKTVATNAGSAIRLTCLMKEFIRETDSERTASPANRDNGQPHVRPDRSSDPSFWLGRLLA